MTGAYRDVTATDAALDTDVRAALGADAAPAPAVAVGLLGCGWIGGEQLAAYRAEGFEVVAVADRHPERAAAHRDRWAPGAAVYGSAEELVAHPGLGLVAIATHPDGRPDAIRNALAAGVAVLSQKPFVEDLVTGRALAAEADAAGVTLAVDQNGRWAPHFGALLAVARSGIIGRVVSADFAVDWPHEDVVADKPAFAGMPDLVLYDFGAHWFDIVGALAPADAELTVSASAAVRPSQRIAAPMQADALVEGDGFRAALRFRAAERFAESGAYRVSGTEGVVTHRGASLGGDEVVVETARGKAVIGIESDWFRWGLAGTMREAMAATAERRRPSNDAASALRGLELVYAALASSRTGERVVAGKSETRS